jgi:Ser/Thr protein kinase RdoA (MazF antagonist)
MLQLKELFSNENLAVMALGYWEYDNLDFLKYFRISGSIIYPFQFNNDTRLLRLMPESDSTFERMQAECELMLHLQEHNLPSMNVIPSKDTTLVKKITSPWGNYYGYVVKRVPGESLEDVTLTETDVEVYGELLARFHEISSSFKPANGQVQTLVEKLEWCFKILNEYCTNHKVLEEHQQITAYFTGVSQKNYQLTHFDFELDNVFYDKESKIMYPIDFGDIMIGPLSMDMDRAINSLQTEGTYDTDFDVVLAFKKGYARKNQVPNESTCQGSWNRRFCDLYSYCRILRSLSEHWENEPHWMIHLRKKLEYRLQIFESSIE